ncbi:MAG: hypothetical protein Q9207_007169 [Kuettlingeria erythrocarpa]
MHCSRFARRKKGQEIVLTQERKLKPPAHKDSGLDDPYRTLDIIAIGAWLPSPWNQLSSLLDLRNGYAPNVLAEESRRENAAIRGLAEKSTRDAAAVKISTVITSVYLPVAVGFFSTQFIQWQSRGNGTSSLVVTHEAWLLAAIAAPLTLFTLILWHHYGQPEIAINQVEDAKIGQFRPQISVDSIGPGGRKGLGLDQDIIGIAPISRRNSESLGTILCTLRVSLFRFNPPGEVIQISNRMVAPGEFEDIVDEAASVMRQHLKDTCAQELLGKDLLFRSGRAAFDCSDGKKTRELMSQPDWDIIRADIATLCYPRTLPLNHDVNDVNVHVDVRCDFITLRNCQEGTQSFAATKGDEIYSLRREADLNLISSRETIRKVIEEDKPAGMSVAGTDQLVSSIFGNARILFAMCVDARLRMACLKVLMDKGFDDTKFPVRKDDRFANWQGSFRAAEFNLLGVHQDFDAKVVVLLHYYPSSPEEGSLLQEDHPSDGWVRDTRQSGTDKDRSCCGYGSASRVFRVKIDEDQHKLSEDKTVAFAVKEFLDKPRRRGKGFERELKVLKRLQNFSHRHLVTHLATWIQNDRYFVLFPFATCNLRTYMWRWTFGPPRRAQTRWLLQQLHQLADALRIIHNLSEEGGLGTDQLVVPSKESGWHHDLKPENFLFFSTQTTPRPEQRAGEGTICIADFGSG